MKRVTHREIALRLGISQATVSLALSHDRRVAPATRERVNKIAQEMGYVADPALSSLSRYRWGDGGAKPSFNVAYLSGDPDGKYVGQARIIDGAKRTARELGYGLSVIQTVQHSPTALQRILRQQGVKGLILGPVLPGAQPVKLEWGNYITVAVNAGIHTYPTHTVRHFIFEHLRMCWDKCSDAGYERIGIVLPHTQTSQVDAELEAAALWLQSRDPSVMIPTLSFDLYDKHPPLREWIDQHQPDVIIGYAGTVAARLNELGIQYPRDIAYCEILANPGPRIAGCLRNLYHLGETVMQVLDGHMRRGTYGIPVRPRTVLIPPEWKTAPSLPAKKAQSVY